MCLYVWVCGGIGVRLFVGEGGWVCAHVSMNMVMGACVHAHCERESVRV